MDSGSNGISRRSVLQLLAALVAQSQVSCHKDKPTPPPGGSDGGTDAGPSDAGPPDAGPPLDPFAAMAELLAALRKSPDHLPARADALVAQKDPQALLDFVRDELATLLRGLPFGTTGEVMWGSRATLRGGLGTAREKAELLAELYRRAVAVGEGMGYAGTHGDSALEATLVAAMFAAMK